MKWSDPSALYSDPERAYNRSMAEFPSKGASLWLETTLRVKYPALADDTEIDVAIIGGGIAGLTAAYLLAQSGKRVMVCEKQHIGSGVTSFTTGKVTSQHGLIYSRLLKKFGEHTARMYGEANETAIQQIEAIIQQEGINCDWRREDNFVFTQSNEKRAFLQDEAQKAAALDLPAYFTEELPLPFEVQAAVGFRDQATLHVGKYLQGLARAITAKGGEVYEKTKATMFRNRDHTVHFRANGHTVIAHDVIIATNVPNPMVMHGAYAFYEHPSRSYIVAGKSDFSLKGMYINADRPTRSILPAIVNGENWLLIGGEGHMVGVSGPAKGHYDKLSRYAHTHFGVEDTPYQWSTWDYMVYDSGPPLVGPAYPWSSWIFTATGFRKWGLTNATVAAMMLTDTIIGRVNPWAHAFRSNRLSAVVSMPLALLKGTFG